MKKLFLTSFTLLPAIMFAASFDPYLGDEDWSGQPTGMDFLQNFLDPETEKEDSLFSYYGERVAEGLYDGGEYFCTYCYDLVAGDEEAYIACLDEVYEEGVLPVKDGSGNVVRYEFPGCGDPSCPIHHVYGYAADGEGNISEAHPVAVGDEIEKPRLPVGDPFVLAFFAGAYAWVRKRKE